jgi:hypothetical protein
MLTRNEYTTSTSLVVRNRIRNGQSRAHTTVADFCVWRSDVFAVIGDLSELGQHLEFGYPNVIKTSISIVYGGVASKCFRA